MSLLERVSEQEASHNAQAQEHIQSIQMLEMRKQLRRDVVERLGLTTLSSMIDSEDKEQVQKEIKVACEAVLHGANYLDIASEKYQALIDEVIDEITGFGPIQPLLEDDSISEIMINGCKSLYYEHDGEIYAAHRAFDSPEHILTVVDRILAPLGRRLDERNPVVNARLPTGERVNAVISPIALDGPIVTIRKFSARITSLDELVARGALPAWYAEMLRCAVRERCDIAVAGGTGSGKTTLLNALSSEISHDERIITIEDSAELQFEGHPHVIRLESRDASIEGIGEVSIRSLVKNALRMRPDRIVVGEVRGSECIDMLQAMNTGHDGSLTTLHAGTEREAILRLVLMARFGMDLPVDIVEEQIASGLDLLVMSHRFPDGTRRIGSMSQVCRAESSGVELKRIVTFDGAANTWKLVSEPPFKFDTALMQKASEKSVQNKQSLHGLLVS